MLDRKITDLQWARPLLPHNRRNNDARDKLPNNVLVEPVVFVANGLNPRDNFVHLVDESVRLNGPVKGDKQPMIVSLEFLN